MRERYERACRAGRLDSYVALGVQFQDGRGVPRDLKRAVELYRKSCDGGAGVGCFNLGREGRTLSASPRPEDPMLRERLHEILSQTRGNVAAAARAFNKAPVQIRRWCRRFSIDLTTFATKVTSRITRAWSPVPAPQLHRFNPVSPTIGGAGNDRGMVFRPVRSQCDLRDGASRVQRFREALLLGGADGLWLRNRASHTCDR